MNMRVTGILLFLIVISACVPKTQLRTEHIQGNCLWSGEDCSHSYIERYPEFDLAFIEFTERGNLFNRQHSREVLQFIDAQAKTERGAAVFVFVHGWKHSAASDDTNVTQFREFLSRAAENEVVGKRKVIGLYLGWQGKTNTVPIAKELTYWSRKSVAEEIGAGGATEIFSTLHQILIRQFENVKTDGPLYRNTYVIIGHSFGGAIVLSALHDVLLDDLIAANTSLSEGPNLCDNINRFADGLILLNPAIEANKVILLKEASARCVFGENQPKLMHVLSSDGDRATRLFFPLGQYVNPTATLGPKKLKRRVRGKEIVLDERMLDVTTAGNIEQLRTGYLSFDKNAKTFSLESCHSGLSACRVSSDRAQKNHFSTHQNDPLSFIKTGVNFIKDHNDVFGCYVQSFITAVIFETQATNKGYQVESDTSLRDEEIQGCDHRDFDFQQCFNNQLDDYDCDLPG